MKDFSRYWTCWRVQEWRPFTPNLKSRSGLHAYSHGHPFAIYKFIMYQFNKVNTRLITAIDQLTSSSWQQVTSNLFWYRITQLNSIIFIKSLLMLELYVWFWFRRTFALEMTDSVNNYFYQFHLSWLSFQC